MSSPIAATQLPAMRTARRAQAVPRDTTNPAPRATRTKTVTAIPTRPGASACVSAIAVPLSQVCSDDQRECSHDGAEDSRRAGRR